MIERQHLVEEHQASIGHSKLILRQRRQPLDLADDIVGKESHRARRERRQPRQPRRSVPAQRALQLVKDIALEAAPLPPSSTVIAVPRDTIFLYGSIPMNV